MSRKDHKVLFLDLLRIDGGTQPREQVDAEQVKAYAACVDDLPPVEAVFDGAAYWLWDGFHRWHAHRQASKKAIKVRVQPGTVEDARWLASSANKEHDAAGSRRTNEDKRRAVEMALAVKWGESDSSIAAHVGVSDKTVATVRKAIKPSSEIPKMRTVERGGQTYTQDTSNIGKGRKPVATTPVSPPSLPPSPVAPAPQPKDHVQREVDAWQEEARPRPLSEAATSTPDKVGSLFKEIDSLSFPERHRLKQLCDDAGLW